MSRVKESEGKLQSKAISLAMMVGWRVHHTRPARTKDGYRTPITGHKGFPDVVFASDRYNLIVFAEFKSDTGRVSDEQADWGAVLESVAALTGGVVLYRLWYPSDWDEIERVLKQGRV